MASSGGLLRHYGPAVALSAAVLVAVVAREGFGALAPVLLLAALEVTFSVDNAVVNSQTLAKMSRFWRGMFLTVGIAIAVFGVRLVLPVGLVAALSHDSVGDITDLALRHPGRYAERLEHVYPTIAAGGGIFLLMIGLRFFAKRREVRWFEAIEGPFGEPDQPWVVSLGGAALALALLAMVLAPGNTPALVAGFGGAGAFVAIRLLSERLSRPRPDGAAAVGAVGFVYLELLDASFSLDGVVAAFAVTRRVLLIAAGLGIGAVFVRAVTTHLLERQVLRDYRYLVHGAHYAILALAVVMILDVRFDPPPLAAGLAGVVVILAAFAHSVHHNRAKAAAAGRA
ncbi:MAG: hypothetical protein JWM10_4860 [Myxococcaceae bacterium]|nr:hypothetical protein [Myxococcaceae bacterium]